MRDSSANVDGDSEVSDARDTSRNVSGENKESFDRPDESDNKRAASDLDKDDAFEIPDEPEN